MKSKTSSIATTCNHYKRKFTPIDCYSALIFFPRALAVLKQNRKQPLIDEQFIERIMLAVTEVNGCAVCSWAHTQMALQQGMTAEEISCLLSNKKTYIKAEEAKGIIFAQHYADTRGRPDRKAYQVIIDEYGSEKATVILSAAQVIFTGNVYGITYSALISRLKGKSYTDSSLLREISFLILDILIIPPALIHVLFRKILGLPNYKMVNSE
jgi:AhpD family alkylhydroperoxidase